MPTTSPNQGEPPGLELKGAHHLDFRWHKKGAHYKRDPRGLRFLGRKLRSKLGL